MSKYLIVLFLLLLNSCIYHSESDYDKLFFACKNGEIDIVKKFVQNGYNVNYEKCESMGLKAIVCETPFYIAVINEQIDIYEYLLNNGGNLNDVIKTINENHYTINFALKLIESNKYPIKEINKTPKKNEIDIMNIYKYNEMLPLEKDDLNPNIIDENGKHLVEYVMESKSYEILPELFNKGANPNHKVSDDLTIKDLLEEKLALYEKMKEIHNKFEKQNN